MVVDKKLTVELIQGHEYKNKIPTNSCTVDTIQNPPLLQSSEMKDLTQFAGKDIMAVGHSKINCLFPLINLDKTVLFGKNFNFTYPVTPGFHPSALCTHFVCLGVFPLKLGIIVPKESPDIGGEECVAITIKDIRFKAKVFDVEEIQKTLYANFKKLIA